MPCFSTKTLSTRQCICQLNFADILTEIMEIGLTKNIKKQNFNDEYCQNMQYFY